MHGRNESVRSLEESGTLASIMRIKENNNMKLFVCGLLFFVIALGLYGRSRLEQEARGAVEAQRSQAEYVNRVEDRAREEKAAFEKRTKEILDVYASKMKTLLETEELESKLSLQQNIEKLQLKAVQVKNLNEAKTLAKKLAENDKDFAGKQIENSNKLSLYEINETSPFYVKDESVEMTSIVHVDSNLNYTTEEVIKKYPGTGLSEVRYYKYITLSKNKNERNADLMFEEGGIVFVDEKLNLDEAKPEDIYIVSISAPVPKANMIDAIKAHNKSFKTSETKSKEKSEKTGTQSNKKPAASSSKTPATNKANTGNKADSSNKSGSDSAPTRQSLLKGLP